MSLVVWLCMSLAASPVTEVNHPNWRWHTLETEHFEIHYPTSRAGMREVNGRPAADRVAQVADDLWLRMGDVMDFFPGERIHVVIVDESDSLTAWTWPYRDLVVVSIHPGTDLARSRGRTDGLVEVFTHELAHVFTHKAAGAVAERSTLGTDWAVHGESDWGSVGVALSTAPDLPQWWSEGGAEYLASRVGGTWWSAGRNAGLRVSVMDDRLLSWDELQVAQDKSDVMDGERSYQQGFAFFRWLEEAYGPDAFADLHRIASERHRAGGGAALHALTGVDGRELHDAFVTDLTAEVRAWRAARSGAGLVEGSELWSWDTPWTSTRLKERDGWQVLSTKSRERQRQSTGYRVLHPESSDDGAWHADYRAGWLRVRQMSPERWPALSDRPVAAYPLWKETEDEPDTEHWVPVAIGGNYDWVPGTHSVVYTSTSAPLGLNGPASTNRLVRLDLDALPPNPSSRQLRRAERVVPGTDRAMAPSVSPNGRKLAVVDFEDGQTLIRVLTWRGETLNRYRPSTAPVWLSSPSWSPRGDQMVVAMHHGGMQGLWQISLDTGVWTMIVGGAHAAADPVWTEDGIWFTAEVDGVRDVFSMDSDARVVRRLTRGLGQAATPTRTPEGHLLYSTRTGNGWKAMGLRRERFDGEVLPEFVVDASDGSGPALARESTRSDVGMRPYQALGSTQRLSLSPALRLDLGDGQLDPRGGGWLIWRDAVGHGSVTVDGFVGEDQQVRGALTASVLGPDLMLWGGWEDVRQTDRDTATERRYALGGTGVRVDQRVGHTSVHVILNGGHWVQWAQDPLVEPGLVSQQKSLRGNVGVRFGTVANTIDAVGQAGWVTWGRGRGGWFATPASVHEPLLSDYARLEGMYSAATGIGKTQVEVRIHGGTTDSPVSSLDLLRAGGDAPDALRMGHIEATAPLPGFGAGQVAGEHLAVGGLGWRVPLWSDIRRGGRSLYIADIGLRLGVDAGNAWSRDSGRGGDAVLWDTVGELRLAAVLGGQPWNSVVRVARGFGNPTPLRDGDPWIMSAQSTQLVVGVGTGW